MGQSNLKDPNSMAHPDDTEWRDEDVDAAVKLTVHDCARTLGVDPTRLLDAVQRGQLGEWSDEECRKNGIRSRAESDRVPDGMCSLRNQLRRNEQGRED